MASNRLLAPVIAALDIREQYHKSVEERLRLYDIDENTRTTIVTDIYAKDDVYFSLNRPYQQISETFEEFCKKHQLHHSLPEMLPYLAGDEQRIYTHQAGAIESIRAEKTTIISTGTGSGKTESFLIPLLHHCLTAKKAQVIGIKAIILYPLNALANDQVRRILEAVKGKGIRVGCYVGSTPQTKRRTEDDPDELCISREEMIEQPPDILITNYVMLDRLITQIRTHRMFTRSAHTLKYIVVDEIHYFRGTKGANLSLLLRRLRTFSNASLVQIGASGTLRRGGGYYPNQTKDQIETFARLIFGQEAVTARGFTLIEPAFQTVASDKQYEALPPIDTIDGDTFLTVLNETKARVLCEQLFSPELVTTYEQRYCRNQRGVRAFPGYYLALHSLFIHSMRQKLAAKACSFQELTSLFELTYKQTYDQTPQNPRKVVEAYWSLINYLNMRCADKKLPLILDYRIHLILGDVGEELTRCLLCSRYHDGRCQQCRYCNNGLLFKVSETYPQCCIAFLVENALFPEPVKDKRSFPVLVEITSQQRPLLEQQPVFELEPNLDGESSSYLLRPATDSSQSRVLLQLAENKQAIKALLLSEKRNYWMNVLKIVDALVIPQEEGRREKLLGFIDSREGASGVKLRLTDNIAERTLNAWAANNWADNTGLSLVEAFEILKNAIPVDDESQVLPTLTDLLQEMPFWYKRMLTYQEGEDITLPWNLSLASSLTLNANEYELLNNIMLSSAAIDTSSFEQPGGIHNLKFFHIEKYRVENEYGVAMKRANGRGYDIVSLGEQGVLYQDFIQRLTSTTIEEILESLTSRGILVRKNSPSGYDYYQLHPQYVTISVTDHSQPWERMFATIESHTADNSDQERADIEQRFNKKEIHTLICTPTLEMGVDIGHLTSVLMIGFPPSPANYAQRAGRAGRSGKSRLATIVVLSSARDMHDEYYYAFPYKMIDGEITPPQFTLMNFPLLAAHAYAYIMAGEKDMTLLTQTARLQEKIRLFLVRDDLQIAQVIGDQHYNNFSHYLSDDCRKLPTRVALIRGQLTIQDCYKLNIFPDYGFRNDGLPLIDTHTQVVREDSFHLLTAREPEEAPRSLAPGRIVFCGGRAVQVEEDQPDGSYEIQHDPLQKTFRYHRYVVANTTRVVQIERQRDPNILYSLKRFLDIKQPLQSLQMQGRQYCQIYYVPESILYIINEGEITELGQLPTPLKDRKGNYRFGMSLEREGFLIRFADYILSPNMKANFLAVLLRTIPDYFNLDDGELRVVQNVSLYSQTGQEAAYKQSNFFIYGHDKSGLVPFKDIFEHLDKMLNRALHTLQHCSCGGSGCYLCLFSMNSHTLTGHISYQGAVDFLSAYLCIERLKPYLSFYQQANMPFDLTLGVRIKGDTWEIIVKPLAAIKPKIYTQKIMGDQNEALYQLLYQVLVQERSEGASSVKICCKLEYVVRQLCGEAAINLGRMAFFQVWLERLRWQYWQVAKEDLSW